MLRSAARGAAQQLNVRMSSCDSSITCSKMIDMSSHVVIASGSVRGSANNSVHDELLIFILCAEAQSQHAAAAACRHHLCSALGKGLGSKALEAARLAREHTQKNSAQRTDATRALIRQLPNVHACTCDERLTARASLNFY